MLLNHTDFTKMGSEESKKEMRGRRLKLKMPLLVLLLLFATNLLTLHVFRGPIKITPPQWNTFTHLGFSAESHTAEHLLSDLNVTHHNLLATKSEIKSLRAQLHANTRITENLVTHLSLLMERIKPAKNLSDEWSVTDMRDELREIAGGQKLPLGYNRLFQTDTIYAPMGHPCMKMRKELAKYMDYQPGGQCPEDDYLAQKLMLRGCEPLPRRRCLPRTPANYTEPYPFPSCMWRIPSDTTVDWTPYACKSYGCLVDRKNRKDVWVDCKDCFDLQGREKHRWLNTTDRLHFHIDQVLELKKGTVRIGLDLGGGTGTFAVRMRERNVSIVTTSMNLDGPFNNFMASRGVVPMFLTISQRLPFFDNTLDLVHSMHLLSNWIPHALLEFILYDIYRVLRPGGVLWLDHFFCRDSQLEKVYVPMIEGLGYKRLLWHVGRKVDRGIQFKEVYLSALLEKPLSNN